MSPRTSLSRLRQLRRRLTIGYLVVAALSLGALVGVAVAIDAHARADDTDNRLAQVTAALSRAVYYDRGVLHLEPLGEDELATADRGRVAVLEVTTDGTRWQNRYSTAGLPTAELVGVAERAREDQDTAFADVGTRFRVAASPVWDGDRVGAAVVAASDTTGRDTRHRELIWWLVLGSAGLLAVAGAAGHALSGRSVQLAVRSLAQQEQFLADAAHELRNPLATLQAVADNGAPDALQRVSHLSADIARLVTGLLLRARLEAGTQRVEHEPLRLDLLVEQVVDELTPPTGSADVVVQAHACVVDGDPDLLAQAVRNLLVNAVTHSDGRPVRVGVEAGTVTVDDHGPGIPVDQRERVLERHVTGRPGGTGIGLSIVRWVAQEHGGTVRLSEAPGGGTRAELALPPRQVPAVPET